MSTCFDRQSHLSTDTQNRPAVANESSTLLFAINLALLAIAFTWLVIDARLEPTVQLMLQTVSTYHPSEWPEQLQSSTDYGWRTLAVTLLTCAVATNVMLLSARLFSGTVRQRNLRAYLIMASLLCLWLGFATGFSDIAWRAKRVRLTSQLDEYRALAQPLRQSWPRQDGEIPELGPFMAYPVHQPRALVLLTPPQLQQGSAIDIVERSDDGAIRFHLSGRESDAWIEWHPQGSRPTSFRGGLCEDFQLKHALELTSGWYLVHYAEPT